MELDNPDATRETARIEGERRKRIIWCCAGYEVVVAIGIGRGVILVMP